MNVKLWNNFSKRRNSTKIPGTIGTLATCVLKEDTSIVNPTIRLNGHGLFNQNYAYIQDFGRYYFVKDIRTVGPDTEIDLVSDVLASFKSAITGSTQYVERAADTTLHRMPDGALPPTAAIEIKKTDILDMSSFLDPDNSRLIVTSSTKFGTKYYAMTEARWADICDDLFNNPSWGSNLINNMQDLVNCIVSVKRVPYIPDGTSGVSFYVGQFDTQHSVTEVTSAPKVFNASETMLQFPSADHLNIHTFFDCPPYSSAIINLPFVGVVPLDMSIVGWQQKIEVHAYLDERTGDIVYKINTNGNRLLATYAGNCASSVPFAAQTYNALGALAGAVTMAGAVGAAVAGVPEAALAATATSGLLQMAGSRQLHTQINGILSSFLASMIDNKIWVEIITNVPTDWDVEGHKASIGIPYMKAATLSSLSGYVQCRNAHVQCAAFETEKNEIDTFLNTGLFIE